VRRLLKAVRRALVVLDLDDVRWAILAALVIALFAQRAAIEEVETQMTRLELQQDLEGQRGDALTASTGGLLERAWDDELEVRELEMQCRPPLDPVWDSHLAGCRVLVIRERDE